MTEIPFKPAPRDWPGFTMPPSVPTGMRLELSRSKIVPGQEALAAEWMSALNARRDEAAEGLAAEGIAIEATFFNREADGSLWIYHLTLAGQEPPPGENDADPIGELHRDYNERAKMRGWEELEPMLLLMPDAMRDTVITAVGLAEGGQQRPGG